MVKKIFKSKIQLIKICYRSEKLKSTTNTRNKRTKR